MTMISFRIGAEDAAEAQRWANTLGMERSELLREALRRHLAYLAAAGDAARWEQQPPTAEESVLGTVADWGVAEDWSDWADATR